MAICSHQTLDFPQQIRGTRYSINQVSCQHQIKSADMVRSPKGVAGPETIRELIVCCTVVKQQILVKKKICLVNVHGATWSVPRLRGRGKLVTASAFMAKKAQSRIQFHRAQITRGGTCAISPYSRRPRKRGALHGWCLIQQSCHVRGRHKVLNQDLGFAVSKHAHLADVHFWRLVRRKQNIVMRSVFLVRELIRCQMPTEMIATTGGDM